MKSYILFVSTPKGPVLKRFETRRNLTALGLLRTWPPDEALLNDHVRRLLAWMGHAVEWQEWYAFHEDVETEGVWNG